MQLPVCGHEFHPGVVSCVECLRVEQTKVSLLSEALKAAMAVVTYAEHLGSCPARIDKNSGCTCRLASRMESLRVIRERGVSAGVL